MVFFRFILCIALVFSCCSSVFSQSSTNQQSINQQQDKDRFELEQLLNQNVALYRESKTASGIEESIKDAPSALVIITKEDIQRRGYLSLEQVLKDLPGFDVINTQGTSNTAYQRGYRTPFTQRTLLLFNGKVDNSLWSQDAIISKQYSMLAIDRIEVLYGPAGAVYGPNAFLGVINIITKDPRQLKDGEHYLSSQVQLGDYATKVIDFTGANSWQNINAVISGRFYRSNGIDSSDFAYWGFTDKKLLHDSRIWGNAIANSDFNNDGIKDKFASNYLGEFANPKIDRDFRLALSYNQWKFEASYWITDDGYGMYYPYDKGQPNVKWLHESLQYALDHQFTYNELLVSSELVYRQSSIFGHWAENFDGWVSLSNWNSFNQAYRFRQQYQYQLSQQWQINTGIKAEVKQLTKAYTVCGYWAGSLCPAEGGVSDGSLVKSPGHRNTISLPADIARHQFNPDSKITTQDYGAFIQGIYQQQKWRLNLGLRYDHNSEYGGVFNPRLAGIYYHTDDITFKLSYGEAFQEPSVKDLYGGWNGRAANPNLVPETMQNLEFITSIQQMNMLHDISLYRAWYNDVIVNGTFGNVGGRDIWGIEYRGQYYIHNPLFSIEDIKVNANYSYTRALADYQFFQGYDAKGSEQWVKQRDDLGDIAPHKVNVNIDFPLTERWLINAQINWNSRRELYSENPLRAQYNNLRTQQDNVELASYWVADINLLYRQKSFDIGLKVENLFGRNYYQPGVESANSGDDFTNGSTGFINSLIPQPNKPLFTLYLTGKF